MVDLNEVANSSDLEVDIINASNVSIPDLNEVCTTSKEMIFVECNIDVHAVNGY